ncbi:hypothetical protein CAPTEDRAFT_21969 [Capitella teleta]|uniref:Sulfatase N-terminal domain-containing protein n=1 Tax=Capitella teleta TaxID=283909 RepID=R7TPT8_CAPTE|nr:hypothetical protein CAPTEDRAFT_21969 [Capitella teleta]|eukprot:ELT93060.1 hypothetical protein CAPTEDRAFT_21969 [Capitella teleta]
MMQPNIIWIFGDDYGFNDVGFRNPNVISPNMDALAQSGIILTNAYTAPQCSPSRGSFLSGRYSYKSAMQHGVILDNKPQCLGLDYTILPGYLKELGYETHAFGKWHLGYCRDECTPTHRGFDSFSGGFSGEGEFYEHTTATGGYYDWHLGTEVDYDAIGKHSEDLIGYYVNKTLDEYDQSSPLFMYVAFHNVHSPLDPKPEFLALYDDLDVTDDRKKYLGLVSGMDYIIGGIVDKIKEIGIYENTYILFSSDNGGDVGEGDNSPHRGGKSTLWEGGCKANSWTHSPLLGATGVENNGLMHVTDWLPTIVDLAGGSVPASDGLDGVVQTDMVINNGDSARTTMIYNIDRESDIGQPKFGEMACRNLQYKLIWGFPGQQDGYGADAKYIYDIPFYQEAAQAYIDAEGSTDKKRGGPYVLTADQTSVLNNYMSSVHVSDQELADGTGSMLLFDLINDPNETTDLSESTDPDIVAAKAELIKMIQDAVNDGGYVPQSVFETTASDLFDAPQNNNTLTPGWCKDIFPQTDSGTY